MDESTSLKFVNRRIGELTKKYAAAQTTDARTSAIVEELSQLSIVRDELKKTQRKIYTAEQPTERPKIEMLFREMDKLARQMTETRRENRDRSEIVNEITRFSFLADSLSKSNQRTHNDQMLVVFRALVIVFPNAKPCRLGARQRPAVVPVLNGGR